MKLFIDIGSHTGEAVSEAIEPRYAFDRLHCFEPAASSRARFKPRRHPRVTLHPFGLWNQACDTTIFDPGSPGASVFSDKENVDTSVHEQCRFERVSDWFAANIGANDTVYLKLNCEGCECDIIDDLLESGQYHKVDFMLATFDVLKIPSQAHRAAETRARLEQSGYRNYMFTDMATLSVHVPIQTWLHFWLRAVGADRSPASWRLRQVGSDLRRLTRRSGSLVFNLLGAGR